MITVKKWIGDRWKNGAVQRYFWWVWNRLPQTGTWIHVAGTGTQSKHMVPVLGPNEAQVLEVSLQKEFSEKQSDMRLPRWHDWERICLQWSFNPWVRKIPQRRKWQTTSVFLPGESHRQRSLMRYIPWGLKESDMTEQLSMQELDLFQFRGKHALYTECGPSQAMSAAVKCIMVSFYRLGNFIC